MTAHFRRRLPYSRKLMAKEFSEFTITWLALRAKLCSRSVFSVEDLFFGEWVLFWRRFSARANTGVVHDWGRGTITIASHGQSPPVEGWVFLLTILLTSHLISIDGKPLLPLVIPRKCSNNFLDRSTSLYREWFSVTNFSPKLFP